MNRRDFLGWMTAAACWGWPDLAGARPQGSMDWQPHYGRGLPIHLVADGKAPKSVASTLEVARRLIVTHCTDLQRANAVNHGIRALGRDLPLGTDDAFRLVLETLLEETYLEGQLLLEVPVQREGHRHSLLKTLLEKQCEFDLEFTLASGTTWTFADYVRSARTLHSFDLRDLALDEQSWAILAFTRVMPPDEARWINLHGQVQDLDRILDQTSEGLREDTRLVRRVDLRAKDLPRNCPVFARACGGLHMLYALAAALSCGYETPQRRTDFGEHMRTHLKRLTYDLRVIAEVEELNRERVAEERAAARAFDGRLKFLGHTMEVIGLVDQFALFELSGKQRDQVDTARRQLCDWIIESATLELSHASSDAALHDSLVTSLCHAYNGLRMSPA